MAAPFAAAQSMSNALYAYVGCYTTKERSARGDGIHVYRIDTKTAQWTHVQHVGGLVNPSFLVMSADHRHLYSAHGDEAHTTAFAVDPATGFLKVLNHAETGGSNGAHLATDPSGRFLVVANYASGSVAVVPIQANGGVAKATQVVPLKGTPGPDRVEQTSSHPHHVVFDPSGRWVVVPDKGFDRVFVFRFEGGKLTPSEQGSVVVRSGSGPRHMAFHPHLPIAWVLNEIANTMTTYSWDAKNGSLKPLQILPTLPPDFTGESTASEIAVSAGGHFVYGSNRGHDSIAAFASEPKTGLLTPAGWSSSHGKTPRFIGFDPSSSLLCATNEQSDTVITYRVDASGKLTTAGSPVKTGSPVSVVFAPA